MENPDNVYDLPLNPFEISDHEFFQLTGKTTSKATMEDIATIAKEIGTRIIVLRGITNLPFDTELPPKLGQK